MFDPAVLGTLIIGLDSLRESDQSGSPQPATAPRRPSLAAANRGLVARLRVIADRRHPRVEADGALVGN